jgi:hypothetical protein
MLLQKDLEASLSRHFAVVSVEHANLRSVQAS